jgi:hypothetical protein
MIVKPKSKWVYVGGSAGYEFVHTVIEVKGTSIATWSDIDQGDENESGYTWSGHRDRFLQQFKPVDNSPVI